MHVVLLGLFENTNQPSWQLSVHQPVYLRITLASGLLCSTESWLAFLLSSTSAALKDHNIVSSAPSKPNLCGAATAHFLYTLWISKASSLASINRKPLFSLKIDIIQSAFLYQHCVSIEKGESLTCQTSYTIRFDKSVTYPDGSFVAVDPSDSQPGRQVKHVLQNLFIKLEVGQLPLPLQCTQIDLVRGEILGEPEERNQVKCYLCNWFKVKTHSLNLEQFHITFIRETPIYVTDDLGGKNKLCSLAKMCLR